MGGVLILIALTIATLLWADLTNRYVWCVLIVTGGFGGVGFIDDYLKLTKRSSDGLPGRLKLLIQVVIATAVALWISHIAPPGIDTHLAVPRSEEHTSELQSLMRTSYAVFCSKKKKLTTRRTPRP